MRQRLTEVLRQTVSILQTFWANLALEIRSFLLARTLHIPSPLPKGRRQILSQIFDRAPFQEFVHQFAQENGVDLEHVEKRVSYYLNEIAADLNYLSIPIWDIFLHWLFGRLHLNLVVDEASLGEIRRRYLGQVPIVFVPNHRSHLDYLILSHLLHHNRIPVPHICAGTNLSFWPLGPIFRKAGAFFIRRSYEGNRLYAASVRFYMEELLREKTVLEFFIEGTRSRTGKLLPPRMGILSAFVKALSDGAAQEIVLIPTSLSYETVPEDRGYAAEQSGAMKREEGIRDLFRLGKYLKKTPGKIFVRFGEPLPIRDFVKESPDDEASTRLVVQKIASETTHGINKMAVATPSSLVAMALLTTPGRSVTAVQIQQRIDAYLDYLRFKGCEISPSLEGSPKESIEEALDSCVRERLVDRTPDDESPGPLYAVREDRRVLLDYYKNQAIHFFVSIGVTTTLLEAATEGVVSLKDLEGRFVLIQDLFRNEFTFSRREPVGAHLRRLLEFLSRKEAVEVKGGEAHVPREGAATRTLFASLLRNFFEGYSIVWQSLPTLGRRPWEERELLRWLRHRGRILHLKGQVHQTESWSRFTLQNALAAFRDLGILSEETPALGRRPKRTFKVSSDAPRGEEMGALLLAGLRQAGSATSGDHI